MTIGRGGRARRAWAALAVAAVAAATTAVTAAGCRSAPPAPAAATPPALPAPPRATNGGEPQWGVRLYPGAEPRPEVAAAVRAYYLPSVDGAGFAVAVYETDASFDEVHDFYGPRMERGKWGWRRKSLPLAHQTQTLAFLRQRLVAERGENGRLPSVYAPLFGDPALGDDEVGARLARLAESRPGAKVEIVEGVRPIAGDPQGADVRVIVERPYVDLATFRLVDRTRIQLLRLR